MSEATNRPGREAGDTPAANGQATGIAGREQRLQAYYDGELAPLARRRFERALRRDPALRRDLEALEALGDQVRACQPELASPDLWDAIALRLPAADARRAEPETGGLRGLGWLAWPGAAAATTAAVAAALLVNWFSTPAPSGEVVRWLDSGGHDVMVLEGAPDTTIIWVFDGPDEGASWGGGRETV